MARKPTEAGNAPKPSRQNMAMPDLMTEGVAEIDDTLERLGVGIDRKIEKMDELLSRLRRTRIAA